MPTPQEFESEIPTSQEFESESVFICVHLWLITREGGQDAHPTRVQRGEQKDKPLGVADFKYELGGLRPASLTRKGAKAQR